MPARIIITGFGLVTPLGLGAWATFAALLAGRTISDRAAALPPDIAAIDLARAIGCVAAAQHAADDPAVELAEHAAREAGVGCRGSGVGNPLRPPLPPGEGWGEGRKELSRQAADGSSSSNASWGEGRKEMSRPDSEPAPPLPCFLGTSKGAFRRFDEAAALFALRGHDAISHRSAKALCEVIALGPGEYLSQRLEKRLNIRVAHHAVAACASSLVALHRARLALLNRQVEGDRALVLTADAALTPSLIHAYRKLGVLAPLSPTDYACRPLDQQRQGFVLAEAGAAVMLQRIDDPGSPLPRGSVELIDTGEACDAYDLIRPCRDMPAVNHLAEHLLAGRDIDLIHPHAPGTQDHDPAEMAVYRRHAQANVRRATGCRPKPAAGTLAQLAGMQAPLAGTQAQSSPCTLDFYAHKGALGHTLGASGLVSLVIACLCARAQQRPPMPWLREPIDPAAAAARLAGPPIQTQAIFAAGFGGHAAGAVIRSA